MWSDVKPGSRVSTFRAGVFTRCPDNGINTGWLNGSEGTTECRDDTTKKDGGGNYSDGFIPATPPPSSPASRVYSFTQRLATPATSYSRFLSLPWLLRSFIYPRLSFVPTMLFLSRALPSLEMSYDADRNDTILDFCIVRNHGDYNDC